MRSDITFMSREAYTESKAAEGKPGDAKDVIRILLVDDHPVVRAGLSSMLRTYPDFEVTAGVSDGTQALAVLKDQPVDVILLDLRMPGMDGIETLQALRALDAPPPSIVLTSYESDEDIYQAVRAGTYGYLLKACSEEEMIGAIHAVHAGYHYLPQHIAMRFAHRVLREDLTSRQRQILEYISEGMTDHQVARRLGSSLASVWEEINAMVSSLDRAQSASRAARSQTRKATMADIARQAGVSMATVSRVLNNKGMHTEETRRIVMKVVREFNFQQDSAAASLAMKRAPASEE